MKKLGIYLGLLFCTTIQADPSLCLNMVVKDEASSILACLESVKPLIDYWVIVDLESKDGTPELIKQALEGIPGQLHVRPFVDLEYNRNQALALARGKAAYLLCLDADEQLFMNPSALDSTGQGYFVEVKTSYDTHHAIRFINTQFDWHWVGVSNPELCCPDADSFGIVKTLYIQSQSPSLPFRNMHPYAYKHLLSLHDQLTRKPSSVRANFMIAELYRNAHCPERAFLYYKKRSESGGNEEEIFWSLLQMAKIKEMLGAEKEEVIGLYTRAYNFRPSRIEPRYELARYCRTQGDMMQGHLIAKLALHLPPSNDKIPSITFDQEWIYKYGLWLEYMLCSHYEELHEEAVHGALKLLSMPETPTAIRWIAENVFDAEEL